MMAVSKETPLRRGTWSVTLPDVGSKVSVEVPATVPLADLVSLVAGCLGQFLRLLLQQLIQRFFHAASNHFL